MTDAHAYCHGCDWYATPTDHDYADVLTAADAHSTFTGHKTTVGVGRETATEAMARAD